MGTHFTPLFLRSDLIVGNGNDRSVKISTIASIARVELDEEEVLNRSGFGIIKLTETLEPAAAGGCFYVVELAKTTDRISLGDTDFGSAAC